MYHSVKPVEDGFLGWKITVLAARKTGHCHIHPRILRPKLHWKDT